MNIEVLRTCRRASYILRHTVTRAQANKKIPISKRSSTPLWISVGSEPWMKRGHGQRFSRAMDIVSGQNLKRGQTTVGKFSKPMKQETKSGDDGARCKRRGHVFV